ncbi:MOSC domain-containing protein [Cupriavidus necator]|uniref:MOSC domain-containing protein n=1 Tax=Cupriavidus necator TaxID=106590 RepID=A0A1U9UUB7_CUPNE|nr:MOSC domain-containing protein [Cupriavidus necator]AQV96288.1 MOSC domain-containing protein [Cupriavidus necator]
MSKVHPTEATAAPPSWTGVVRYLHLTPRALLPMKSFEQLTLVAGRGIEGDRYILGHEAGSYSHMTDEGRQITVFEIETLEALARDCKITLHPEEHRRNVTVQGVPLNHLVGRQFWLGETLLEALRLSTPCRHIERALGKAVFEPLINRAGLNCKIVKGGIVRVGDIVRAA